MIHASLEDTNRVVDILARSFDDNKNVNYIVKQDKKRKRRIKRLMEYSFDICYLYGKVFLSNDKKACALISFPDVKKSRLDSFIMDLQLIFNCTGIFNLGKAMRREAKIKKLQPRTLLYYLRFIGVDPNEQGKGIGTVLLHELIEDSERSNRTICLETSTQRNVPWYEKFGFIVYNKLRLGYELFFLKKR